MQTPTILSEHDTQGTVFQLRRRHLGFAIATRLEPAIVRDHADSRIKTKEKLLDHDKSRYNDYEYCYLMKEFIM